MRIVVALAMALGAACHVDAQITLYPIGQTNVLDFKRDNIDFNATVYSPRDPKAYLVEYYIHTCGHCRAFVPTYERLAQRMLPYDHLVAVSAVNCGLGTNIGLCRAAGVRSTPWLVYFPSNATGSDDGQLVTLYRAEATLYNEVMKHVIRDAKSTRANGWPLMEPINEFVIHFMSIASMKKYSETSVAMLWRSMVSDVDTLVVGVERDVNATDAANILLAASGATVADSTYAYRRASPTSRIVRHDDPVVDLPAVLIYRRGEERPVYVQTATTSLTQDLLRALKKQPSAPSASPMAASSATTPPPPVTTTAALTPTERAALYFAAERDIALATRSALLDEVVTFKKYLSGSDLDNMREFLRILQLYYPGSALLSVRAQNISLTVPTLPHSRSAQQLFDHMLEVIEKTESKNISIESWSQHFHATERTFGHPLGEEDAAADSSNYAHCRGSSSVQRGYSCGLWSLFHALTVNAYIIDGQGNADRTFALRTLQAIKGWVQSFFSCRHCAIHFVTMTTNQLPMTQYVNYPADVVMYLWRAHNTVNARLSRENNQDPAFPKHQFPAEWLCPECRENSSWAAVPTLNFLTNYYTNLRPMNLPKD